MTQFQSVLVGLEPFLVLLVAIAFFRSGWARKYPAIASYLTIRGVTALVLECELWGWKPTVAVNIHFEVYFYSFWIAYFSSAVAIFFVIHEIFKSAMQPVPGLRRLGLLAFRWVSVVSIVVSVGAVALPLAFAHSGANTLAIIALGIMRCISVLELCLLAFLALSIHALGRSFRSRLFGLGLGFGMQAATNLIASALQAGNPSLGSTVNVAAQVMTTVVLLTWTAYFAIPEPAGERQLIVLPPGSIMARWNALANGLGQTPEIAVAEPTGFFLQDIEGVVDRVLAKNPVAAQR